MGGLMLALMSCGCFEDPTLQERFDLVTGLP
jgi:hypothetical protein